MKRAIACLLVAVSLLVGVAAAVAAGSAGGGGNSAGNSGSASIFYVGPVYVIDKDEVVYARLLGGGDVRDIYVVNHLTLSGGGMFTDYGDYASVVNLTDLMPIELENGAVTGTAVGDSLYYQGRLDGNDLPWKYSVEYRLDGAAISPESLAGESGELLISLTSAKNASINGVFYNNYMQQITITLDSEKCSNIKADGATVANAGRNRVLVYTVLPKRDARITVSADVRDFEMAGIDITAMPFSMDIGGIGSGSLGIDNLLGDFTLLSDSIAELSDGAKKLASGAAQMATGSGEVKDGSSGFGDGLTELNGQSDLMTDASSQIMAALSQIADSLDGAGVSEDSTEIGQMPVTLSQLADGLDQLSGGTKQLMDGYAQANAAFGTAIAEIPSYQVDEELLKGLSAKASADERALLDQLVLCHTAAMAVKGVFEQAQQSLSSADKSAGSLIDSMNSISAALRVMSAQFGAALSKGGTAPQIKQLADGMSELSQKYADFHDGLVLYLEGVSNLAEGYGELDSGISSLCDGILDLSGGASMLNYGADRLADETADMPERVQNEIDRMTGSVASTGFESVSFASERNDTVSLVQFVFKLEGVKNPEAEKSEPPETTPPGFLSRLTALFSTPDP
ncbi:MAG: hypothetical protein LBH28_04415 [Oscillospiraceae bacterium]|nr:hypothetical protein [Oscillospiraceae bacterium]